MSLAIIPLGLDDVDAIDRPGFIAVHAVILDSAILDFVHRGHDAIGDLELVRFGRRAAHGGILGK